MNQRNKTTAEPTAEPASAPRDVVLVAGPTADEKGLRVLRARQTSDRGTALEIGEVRPLEEGKPLRGDIVRLRPRAETPAVFDVETEFAAASPKKDVAALRPTRTGPAQVATESYRANWDAIWPKRTRAGESGLN